jgi:aspergillopepsin I
VSSLDAIHSTGYLLTDYRWVFSDKLPVYQRKGHSFYVTEVNTTAAPGTPIRQVTGTQMQGYTWAIRYGDGTGASGVVFSDRVGVGNVVAAGQAVEAATQISAQFYQQHSDGLLGLGFGKTNTIKPTKQKTFFENIKGSLKQPLFTVSLKKNAPGTYNFGFIDEKKYTVRDVVCTYESSQTTDFPAIGKHPIYPYQHHSRLLGIHRNRVSSR